MLWRLTRGLPGYVRRPLGLEEARRLVRWRIETRQQRFLNLVDRGIYGDARSPYRRLLAQAGCERGDLHRLVAAEGVEGALRVLAERGVYVTFDELKGRRPVVRGSMRFWCSQAEFDNSLARPAFAMYTGGTGGPASRVRRSLELVDELAIQVALVLEAHGQTGADLALWYTGGINRLLTWSRLGNRTVGWLVPRSRVPWQLAVAAWHLAVVGRVGGHRFPLPRPCPPEDPAAIAAWLARRAGGRPLVLNTVASSGARIGIAARRLGLSLAGVTLLVESEPITPARRRHMEASGARVIVDYSAVEASGLAYSCAAPSDPDDTHVALDRFALVERPRQIGTGSVTVDALLVTSLSPAAPKILLNAELGDASLLESRAGNCCSLGALGLTTHLSRIESYEKLSTEGTTFARSNVAQILDEALPRRFGGTGLDYQIVEEERADGSTALCLRVDPSVGVVDEAALRRALVEELARAGMVARHHADLLRRVGSIEVVRRPPLATPAGKVLPLHLARRSGL